MGHNLKPAELAKAAGRSILKQTQRPLEQNTTDSFRTRHLHPLEVMSESTRKTISIYDPLPGSKHSTPRTEKRPDSREVPDEEEEESEFEEILDQEQDQEPYLRDLRRPILAQAGRKQADASITVTIESNRKRQMIVNMKLPYEQLIERIHAELKLVSEPGGQPHLYSVAKSIANLCRAQLLEASCEPEPAPTTLNQNQRGPKGVGRQTCYRSGGLQRASQPSSWRRRASSSSSLPAEACQLDWARDKWSRNEPARRRESGFLEGAAESRPPSQSVSGNFDRRPDNWSFRRAANRDMANENGDQAADRFGRSWRERRQEARGPVSQRLASSHGCWAEGKGGGGLAAGRPHGELAPSQLRARRMEEEAQLGPGASPNESQPAAERLAGNFNKTAQATTAQSDWRDRRPESLQGAASKQVTVAPEPEQSFEREKCNKHSVSSKAELAKQEHGISSCGQEEQEERREANLGAKQSINYIAVGGESSNREVNRESMMNGEQKPARGKLRRLEEEEEESCERDEMSRLSEQQVAQDPAGPNSSKSQDRTSSPIKRLVNGLANNQRHFLESQNETETKEPSLKLHLQPLESSVKGREVGASFGSGPAAIRPGSAADHDDDDKGRGQGEAAGGESLRAESGGRQEGGGGKCLAGAASGRASGKGAGAGGGGPAAKISERKEGGELFALKTGAGETEATCRGEAGASKSVSITKCQTAELEGKAQAQPWSSAPAQASARQFAKQRKQQQQVNSSRGGSCKADISFNNKNRQTCNSKSSGKGNSDIPTSPVRAARQQQQQQPALPTLKSRSFASVVARNGDENNFFTHNDCNNNQPLKQTHDCAPCSSNQPEAGSEVALGMLEGPAQEPRPALEGQSEPAGEVAGGQAKQRPASPTTRNKVNNVDNNNHQQDSKTLPVNEQASPDCPAPAGATQTIKDGPPTSSQPVNNRSILILREIEQDVAGESVRNIFDSENCPSRPTHCEYALRNSWYVTFATDEHAKQALAFIRKYVISWQGQPIMARFKPKPAVASASDRPPAMPSPSSSASTSNTAINLLGAERNQPAEGADYPASQYPFGASSLLYYSRTGPILGPYHYLDGPQYHLTELFTYNNLAPVNGLAQQPANNFHHYKSNGWPAVSGALLLPASANYPRANHRHNKLNQPKAQNSAHQPFANGTGNKTYHIVKANKPAWAGRAAGQRGQHFDYKPPSNLSGRPNADHNQSKSSSLSSGQSSASLNNNNHNSPKKTRNVSTTSTTGLEAGPKP